MAPSIIVQRRTHNSLLFQKLLNLRDGISPFTLMLDSLEQSAQPVITEFISRAKISKVKIIFVSFETLRKPKHADVLIKARGKLPAALQQEIAAHLPTRQTKTAEQTSKTLLIIDTLYTLATSYEADLATFLSSLVRPATSILAVYHLDIPCSTRSINEYAPNPLTLLNYLATAVLKVSSMAQTMEKKSARDKSRPEPGFGLGEDKEGVLFGLTKFRGHAAGHGEVDGAEMVVEMEVRRRSGRAVRERFVLAADQKHERATGGVGSSRADSMAVICLLDDHPLYAPPNLGRLRGAGDPAEEDGLEESTFNLELTTKQRRDREGVVLPYFDAQSSEGPGDGGRILYEMDRGDDFDEEEDEI